MDYLDFVLRIDIGQGDGLVVRLVDSPAGQAEAPFVPPPVEPEVERTAEGLERSLEGSRAASGLRDSCPPDPSSPVEWQKRIGDRLFQALLPGALRDRYHHSLGHLGRRQDVGLRIKLQMGLGNPRLAALQSLPWELLYRSEDDVFLGRTRRTSIVRHLDLPLPGELPRLPMPLRVLLVAPQPRGLRPLPHVEREVLALRKLAGSHLDVVPLETSTLEGLRQSLLSGRYDVLHFLGHGGFRDKDHEGVLYLENGKGRPAPVSGPLLADHLRDITSLRLAVLNACQTARTAAPGPFGGVATALLRTGLPAVVAMQFPIGDRAASAFSSGFYGRLVAGDPVDAAVAEGRLKIRRDLPDAADWATPVLFLRAPDGHVFEPPQRSRKTWVIAAAGATGALLASLALLQTHTGGLQPRQDSPATALPAASPAPQRDAAAAGQVSPPPPTTPTPPPAKKPGTVVHLLIPTSMSDAAVWLDARKARIKRRTATVITIEVPAGGGDHLLRLEKNGSPPCVKTIPGDQDGITLTPCQD